MEEGDDDADDVLWVEDEEEESPPNPARAGDAHPPTDPPPAPAPKETPPAGGAKDRIRPAAGPPPDDDDVPTWDLEDVEDEPPAPEAVAALVGDPAEPPAAEEVLDLSVDPGVSDDAERAALLAAFLREQERRSRTWVPPEPRRSDGRTRLAAGALLVVAFWLWVLPPAWLQPDLPPPVPVELQEAGLRLGMYLQAQQIEAFRRARGRLPDVLEETGEPIPGMHYRRLDARTYRLHGVAASVALTYTSSDTLSVFLSNAQHVVGFGPSR